MAERAGYRQDIDGLRAIAVLPVVIYHIAQNFMRGGFVGVDIFFVISGYLISSHIVRDAQGGQFSPIDFYLRRIRRILPASLVLLAVVTAIVCWRFFPDPTDKYAQSMLATLASGSNIFFWATANYFNSENDVLPLLHTWSLAVEEQFYLVFPVLVLGILRWGPKRLKPVIAILALLSLGFSIWQVKAEPTAAFYLLPARAWELLLGTLLAIGAVPAIRSKAARDLLSLAGLVLVGAPMLLLSAHSAFPGAAAIAPCLGAALIIHTGEQQDSWAARLLSLPPFVFVGLISYSLYLWHWPVMVFQRTDLLLVSTPSRWIERGTVLMVSLVLATLSWALVERPTRNRALVSTRALLIGVGGAMLALGAAGAAMIASSGWQSRFPPAVNAMAAYLHYDRSPGMREHVCLITDKQPLSDFDRAQCLPDLPGRPTYMLVGDSHGAAIAPGLRAAFADANVWQVTASGCLPTLDPQPQAPSVACHDVMALGLEQLPAERHIDAVLLTARFGTAEILDQTVAQFVATAEALHRKGLKVVMIGPNPEYIAPLPGLLAGQIAKPSPGALDAQMSAVPGLAEAKLKAAMAHDGIPYVSVIDTLCHNRSCQSLAAPGVPMLFDTDHMTAPGAVVVASRLRPQIEAAIAR